MTAKTKIAFLWHMHQPFYRNPFSGKPELPWVRLHGLKSYYGMAKILEAFPTLKATYNLVPSLLLQLEQYLDGESDRFRDIFQIDARSLSAAQHHFLTRHFFSAHYERMIKPYPRYDELYRKRKSLRKQWKNEGRPIFTVAEARDLQIWFMLTYFDEEYKDHDPRIRGLIEKGRDYNEADKVRILEAERELLGKIIPLYKKLAENGQIELSTTPFYHPILPLLLDPQQGRVANPTLPAYRLRFNWQEDAVQQITRALSYMETRFHRPIRGIWPSEGSLSEDVVHVLHQQGIKWTATDERNLAQSLGMTFKRDESGTLTHPHVLYRPYVLGNTDTRVFFRDCRLSDLIGFHYRRLSAADAADHLAKQLKNISAASNQISGFEPVVSIILDGENAWEYYEKSGRDFLREFFKRVEADDELETVTFSQCLDLEAGKLERLSPGSWINGNFDIWIGDREDRRAWQRIKEAREAFMERKAHLSAAQIDAVNELLYIAQGSDWFWWFGKENHTVDLDIFDRLFRDNLRKIYEVMDQPIPEQLNVPISEAVRRKVGQDAPLA